MKVLAFAGVYLLLIIFIAPAAYEFGYCMNIQDGTPCHPEARHDEEPCAYESRVIGLTTVAYTSSAYVGSGTVYVIGITTSGIAEDITPRRPRC